LLSLLSSSAGFPLEERTVRLPVIRVHSLLKNIDFLQLYPYNIGLYIVIKKYVLQEIIKSCVNSDVFYVMLNKEYANRM